MQKKDLTPDEFDDEVVISDLDSGKKVTRISLEPRAPRFKMRVRPLEISVAVLLVIILVIAIPRLQASNQASNYMAGQGQVLPDGHILFTTTSSNTGSALTSYSEDTLSAASSALAWSFDSKHLFFATSDATLRNITTSDPNTYIMFFGNPSTLINRSYDIATGKVSTQNTQKLPDGQYYPLNLKTYTHNYSTSYANSFRYIFYSDGQHQADPANGTLYLSVLMLDRVTGKATEIWQEVASDSTTSSFCSATTSDDGRYILFCGKDGMLHIWDATIGQEVHSFLSPDQKQPLSVSWSSDDQQLALSTNMGGVIVDTVTGHTLQILPKLGQTFFEWSPYKSRLYSIQLVDQSPQADGRRMAVDLWDSATGKHLGTSPQDLTTFPRWLPDSRVLLMGEKEIETWDSQTGQIVARVPLQKSFNDMPQVSPDGRLFAVVGAGGGTVRVWSTTTGKEVYVFHNGDAASFRPEIYWSPDSQYIAIGRGDGTIAVWNARIGSPGCQYKLAVPHSFNSTLPIYLSWSPDGRMIAAQTANTLAILQAP